MQRQKDGVIMTVIAVGTEERVCGLIERIFASLPVGLFNELLPRILFTHTGRFVGRGTGCAQRTMRVSLSSPVSSPRLRSR